MQALRKLLALPVVALTIAACASGGGGGGTADEADAVEASGDAVQITIVNNTMPPTSTNIRIEPQGFSGRLLGSLNPGQTQTFSYEPADPGANFTLLSQPADGSRLRSEVFSLTGFRTVRWDVSQRNVQLGR